MVAMQVEINGGSWLKGARSARKMKPRSSVVIDDRRGQSEVGGGGNLNPENL